MKRWLTEVEAHRFELEVLSCPKIAVVTFLKKGVASGDLLLSIFERFARESRSDIAFFKVDVDQCPEVTSHYCINKIPTTLIFLRGKVAAHFFGVMSAQKVRRKIEALA